MYFWLLYHGHFTEQHEGKMCFNGLIYGVDKTVSSGAGELELSSNPLLEFSFLDMEW